MYNNNIEAQKPQQQQTCHKKANTNAIICEYIHDADTGKIYIYPLAQ